MGDDWVQRHRRIVQQHANQYRRNAWEKVFYWPNWMTPPSGESWEIFVTLVFEWIGFALSHKILSWVAWSIFMWNDLHFAFTLCKHALNGSFGVIIWGYELDISQWQDVHPCFYGNSEVGQGFYLHLQCTRSLLGLNQGGCLN